MTTAGGLSDGADPSHAVFTLAVAPHEQASPYWRLRHAAETFSVVCAWFEEGAPSAGPYRLHAPSRTTLDTLRTMITEHEGMVIVSETNEAGLGIHDSLARDLGDGR